MFNFDMSQLLCFILIATSWHARHKVFANVKNVETTSEDIGDGPATDMMATIGDQQNQTNVVPDVNTTAVNETEDDDGDDDGDDEDHPLYDFSEKLFLVVIPLITFGGVICNGLMFSVMRRPSLRRTPVAVYMSALAVGDSLVLILDFLNNWVHFVSGYHMKSSSAAFCQFYNWIFSTTFTYCAWLVVAVAIERIIVVWFPFKAKSLCTVKKAIIVVCSMAVACAIYNSYNFLIWELNDERNGRCDMNPEYEYFHRYVYSWISNVAYCYVPVILLIIANTLISVGLSKANKARQKLTGEEMSESKKVTITVITICVTFICLTVPLTLFYVIIYSSDQFVTQSPGMALARTLVLILGLTNHAINFFLYVLTSANFRKELRAMLGIKTSAPARPQRADDAGEQGTPASGSSVPGTEAVNKQPGTGSTLVSPSQNGESDQVSESQ